MNARAAYRIIIFHLLLLAIVSSGPIVAAGTRPLLLDRDAKAVASDLNVLIPELIQQGRVPGLQIALMSNGSIVWSGAFGVANTASRAPVTSETIFEAASLTKPFFAYLVMKLVDEGVVNLDTPLVKYVPREEIEKVLGHSMDLEGFRRDWLEKITSRHVLSHSSGLPHGEGGKPYPIFFEPGTQYKYSAEGYYFLQMAVERLKGRKLDAIMKEYVLDPLGMTRSSMVWREPYENTMANGHDQFRAPQDFRKRTEAHAAASLYTTAADYARFVCAVMNGDGLKAATWKEMLTPQITVDKDRGLEWSLGFCLQTDTNGTAFWQWGDYGIFRNYVIAYPGQKIGVVYLTNSFSGLTICRELVARSIGGEARGVEFLNYLPYDSPVLTFLWAVQDQGPESVEKILPAMTAEHPDLLSTESLSKIVGLLDDGRHYDEIIAVLNGVAGKIPPSAAADAALAGAYLGKGDLANAKACYLKALASPNRENFDSTSVDWRMSFIEAIEEPVKLEADYLKSLAGNYGPRHITFREGKLYYLRDNVAAKDPRELIPMSSDTFVMRELPYFRLRFEIAEGGRPAKIIGMYEGGATDESPRD